jgi:hypothetical protein
MRCLQQAAQQYLYTDESYVRWLEAATSMDTSGGPERVEAVYPPHGAIKTTLAPPRLVRLSCQADWSS